MVPLIDLLSHKAKIAYLNRVIAEVRGGAGSNSSNPECCIMLHKNQTQPH